MSDAEFVLIFLWIGGWIALLASEFLLRRALDVRKSCVRCGYSRAGLSTASPCPECGKSQPPQGRYLRETTANRFLLSASCAWPFALLPSAFWLVGGVFSPTRGEIAFVLGGSLAAYVFIHLAAFAIARFRANRELYAVTLAGSATGVVAHLLLFADLLWWHVDALNGLAIMASAFFVLPAAGYGILIASVIIARRARRSS